MSSPVPRQELLEVGRKKLKDYQQKRRSMNTPPTQTKSTTSANKRLSTSSIRWQSDKSLSISPTHAMSTVHSVVTSPTSFNEEGYPLPPPGIMSQQNHPPPPPSLLAPTPVRVQLPTASTPVPSSSPSRPQRNTKQLRHERSQSINVTDYASQFPSTWAYASSSRISLNKPTSNMDEAMIWIQQNNRLVQENLRLKKELDLVRKEKEQLTHKLQHKEDQLLQILQEKDVKLRKALEEER